MDVFIPAADPPDGVIHIDNTSRDGLTADTGQVREGQGACVQTCLDSQRKVNGPYDDCSTPYGGATATCTQDAKKGAEAKARAAIGKACKKEGAACYSAGGNCPDGANFVVDVEDDVDGTAGLVYCLEAAGVTPTKPQAKCEDGVAKSLIKFTGSKSKCYDTCVDKEFKGKIPPGSCTTGSPSDAATQSLGRDGRGQSPR